MKQADGALDAVVLERRITRVQTALRAARQQLRAEKTARRRAERELAGQRIALRQLGSQLNLAEQRERRRLALVLHDEVGQSLAAARIHLLAMRDRNGRGDAGQLELVLELLDQAIKRSRTLTCELSPPVLHELGFAPAVQWLGDQLRQRHGLEVEMEDDGSAERLDDERRVLLFQSLRELLMNVVKHAGCGRARVCISGAVDELSIAVEDEGPGFARPLCMEKAGRRDCRFGLFSVRERLHFMGGALRIDFGRGSGARVEMSIPLGALAAGAGR